MQCPSAQARMLARSVGVGEMEDRRKSQRRVTPERRVSPRRVRQIPVSIDRRTAGERRKVERRVLADRREESAKLTCPVCKVTIVGSDPMINHLKEEHDISSRQATFLTAKMIKWKQEKLDPTLFPPERHT